MFKGYIYKITNTVNAKIYIGATTHSIHARFSAHISLSKSGTTRLYGDMRKFGVSEFKVSLIKTCYSKYQLGFSEKYFISLYNTQDEIFGYNISPSK